MPGQCRGSAGLEGPRAGSRGGTRAVGAGARPRCLRPIAAASPPGREGKGTCGPRDTLGTLWSSGVPSPQGSSPGRERQLLTAAREGRGGEDRLGCVGRGFFSTSASPRSELPLQGLAAVPVGKAGGLQGATDPRAPALAGQQPQEQCHRRGRLSQATAPSRAWET